MNPIFTLSILSLASAVSVQASTGWEPYFQIEKVSDSAYEDVAGGPEVGHTEYAVGATAFMRSKEGQLALDGSYSYINLDWSGGSFPVGSPFVPFEEVESLSLSGMWTGLQGDNWGYSVLLGLSSNRVTKGGHSKAGFSDALETVIGAGLNYRFSRDLMIGIVGLYRSEFAGIDEDWMVFPQIYWKINDSWTLQTRQGLVLSWSTDSDAMTHRVEFSALVANETWHLGEMASTETGYEEEAFAFGIAYEVTFASGFTVRPSLSYLFDREVNIWQNGRRVGESDLEDGIAYGLKLSYSF